MSTVTFGNTIGAAYLGVIGAAILFGVTNLQTYIYYLNFPHDWQLRKVSVGILWVMDAFHLSLTIHIVYHYLIDSFGNVAALSVIVWSFPLQIAVNITIILLVQSLYALRIWRFGRHFHSYLPWIIVVVVAAGYSIGIILAVETYRVDTFLELETISWAIYTSFSAATGVDFMLAIAMCVYLQRGRSGFSATNTKIGTLMRYIVASGLATSACSMAALITYAIMPHTLVFLGIEFLLTKLYINSFLAMLNARHSMQERNEDGVSISISKLRTADYVFPTPADSSLPLANDDKNFFPPSPMSQDSHGRRSLNVDSIKAPSLPTIENFHVQDIKVVNQRHTDASAVHAV